MKEITLCLMTKELCHQFFRDHESDPAVYADQREFQPYVYSKEAADSFYERKQVPGRLELVAMSEGQTIGHVQLKNIDKLKRECELGFHMQNDSFKGLGYGTRIARLALQYAFENLGMEAVCAYTLSPIPAASMYWRKLDFSISVKRMDFGIIGVKSGIYQRNRPLDIWID